jgi:hypothetical protein
VEVNGDATALNKPQPKPLKNPFIPSFLAPWKGFKTIPLIFFPISTSPSFTPL